MVATAKDSYVTKTGMVIDTSHAFFNLPGAAKIFPPIKASEYHRLEDALNNGLIDKEEKLLLFQVEDATISIPFKQLAFHHVAQGQYNNSDWLAAFCACCNMGAVLKPIIDGELLHFVATGVYHGMAIFRDNETGSFWEHATGECVHGKLRGKNLDTIPTQYALAKQLLETTPSVLLVLAKQSWFHRLLDRYTMGDFLTEEGFMPPPFRLSLGEMDKRLPEMQLGLGIWIDEKARFYSKQTLKAHNNALIDSIGQDRFLIYVDPATNVPIAHRCKANSASWEGDMLVLDTGERIHNGFVETDSSAKKALDSPHQQFVRWYAFAFKFPNCEIYGD